MNTRLMGKSLLALCLPALLGGQAAHAAVDIDFAGFASFVYAKTVTDDDKESVSSGSGNAFNGMSNEGEYRDFNKLGLRMQTDLQERLSFTAQVIAEGSNDYDPEFDWIFLTYELMPALSLTVGKYRVPVFMYSDYLDTSYAYQWIAPPITIYNAAQTPFKSMEGLKLGYMTSLGAEWNSELLVWGGNAEDDFAENGVDSQLILDNTLGIAWTVERDWLTLRAFYMEADTTLDVKTNPVLDDFINDTYGGLYVAEATGLPVGAFPAISTVEAQLSGMLGSSVNLHDDLLWENDPGKFYGIGGGVDFEHWFARTEITRIEVDTNIVVPVMDSYYVMAGTRLPGRVTVSLTYGEDKDRSTKQIYDQFDRYIGISPVLDGMLIPYQQGVEDFADSIQHYDIKATTLTTRWDFHRSAALKFEYLIHEWENTVGKNTPHAIRLGLDLVF